MQYMPKCLIIEAYKIEKKEVKMGFKEKYLKEGSNPYFIAEIGINHNG